MRGREIDKKEPQCHTLAAMGLDIYLAMPKRSVASAPNISLELSIIVIKLSIIVLYKIPLFLNIFVASEAQRIFD